MVFTQPNDYETQYQATPAPPPQYEQHFQVVQPPRPEEGYYRYPVTSTQLPVTQNEYLTVSPPVTPKVEDSSLGDLLKHLQETNALPPTLTADNIDNSIKTLMRILDALKVRQVLKFFNSVLVRLELTLTNFRSSKNRL